MYSCMDECSSVQVESDIIFIQVEDSSQASNHV